MTVLSVEDLRISYRSRGEWREVVHNISFSIQRGEMLAFVGESGSGKTTTAQAIIGLLADNARRDAGRIVLNGEVISDWSDKRLNRLRGVSISLVPQDPGNSLNPVKTIGQQVEEILRLHQSLSAAERRQQVLNLLAKVGLSHPEQRFDQYPHQLSGGMKQRVLIAIAIALQPDLIIADEPTSALDVTVQKRILDLLDILRRESGTAVLFVTHDLALAAERADRIMVFRQGEIQEQGATEAIVQRPQHPYTCQLLHDLLDAPLRLTAARHRPLATPAIRVEGISKRFSLGKQACRRSTASALRSDAAAPMRWWANPAPGKPPWRGSCWALSAPTPDRSSSTVSTPDISAARRSVSCGGKSSLSTRTPSLRSTRARRCLRLSKSR